MRVLVVGAGSIGGYFGGRLAAAGRDVTFLVRPASAARLERDGLRIVSPAGDLALEPKTITADKLREHYDVILLAVKAYSLDDAMEDFAPAVGPQTMILPLLNGLRHLDTLSERFGVEAVLGGTTYISTDVDGEGRIVHLGQRQNLIFGERSGAITPRVEALLAVLSNANIEQQLSGEILTAMWRKWMTLAPLGAITCLLRGTIGEAVSTPEGAATVDALIAESTGIALDTGLPIGEEALAHARSALTRAGSSLTSSMYRDLMKGAPVEADQIIGDMIVRGTASGIDAPLLRAAYAQLMIYQARRSAE